MRVGLVVSDRRPLGRLGSKREWRDRRAVLLLGGPAVLWFAVFMLWPLVDVFVVSATSWNSLLDPAVPIGLGNYERLAGDPRFWRAVSNSVVQVSIGMTVVLPAAFFLGYFLSRRPPGYQLFALVFFTPAITAITAKAIMFTGLFLPDGVINAILESVGLGSLTRFWLGDPSTALAVLIALDVWGGIGFFAVLFRAALSVIPEEMYEAAELESASSATMITRIALPMTLDFVGVAMTLHFLYLLLASATNVLLITGGGPGDFSLTLPYYLYERAFVAKQIGYSQAIAAVLFVVGLVGMVTIRKATRRDYQ